MITDTSRIRFVLDIWCDENEDIITILREAVKDVKKNCNDGGQVVGCLGQYRYWLEYPKQDDPIREAKE